MKFKKQVFLALFYIGIFGISGIAHADVKITEIMYDVPGTDTDREWIEIQNTGTTDVDITKYKFVEDGINHGLASNQGGSTLRGGEYAIITDVPAKFLVDTPGFKGVILDSSFSLTNESGEQLSLKDPNGAVVDSTVYNPTLGAAGDGMTLQKSGSSWVVGPATPGGAFAGVGNGSSSVTNSGSSGSHASTLPVSCVEISNRSYCIRTDSKKEEDTKKEQVVAQIPNTGYIHSTTKIPFTLYRKNTALLGELITISYGDGTTEKVKFREFIKPEFRHIYEYEGEYTVTIEYFENENGDAKFSDEGTITIKTPQLFANFFDETGLIELKNDSDEVFNAGEMVLHSGETVFTIPKNTKIQKKSRLLLSPKVTKFTTATVRKPLSLLSPDGTLLAEAPSFLGEDPAELLAKIESQKDEMTEEVPIKKQKKESTPAKKTTKTKKKK